MLVKVKLVLACFNRELEHVNTLQTIMLYLYFSIARRHVFIPTNFLKIDLL